MPLNLNILRDRWVPIKHLPNQMKLVKGVLSGDTNLDSTALAKVSELKDRKEVVNAILSDAHDRAMQLNSTQKGYTNTMAVMVAQKTKVSLPQAPSVFFSEARLTTVEGIRDLASWAKLGSNPIHAQGSQTRQQLFRLASRLREQLPPGHPGRNFYGQLSQLDSQAVFILESQGFWERFRDELKKMGIQTIDTDQLLMSLASQGNSSAGPWQNIIDELKEARKFNRRALPNF